MDHELTKQIGAWLEQPASERDLQAGALLVLRLSNNRVMYNNFMRNPERSAKMIEYQLQKYYNFRIKDLTHQQVVDMQNQVEKIVKRDHLNLPPINNPDTAPQGGGSESEGASRPDGDGVASRSEVAAVRADAIRKGRRPDHDALPDNIKALYVENLTILQRMRNTHAKLELLSVENATCPDSERYPFLKELIELDKKYHENWSAYDHFDPSASTPAAKDSADSPAETPAASVPAEDAAPSETADESKSSSTVPADAAPEVVKPKRTTRKTTKK